MDANPLYRWIRLFGALLLAAALAACTPQAPLRLAIHPWIGYETLYLARGFGWLPAHIELREGASLSESVAALVTGEVDAAALTLDEVLLARSRGVSLTVVMVFNVSNGADVLLARPGIERLTDLAGRRVGIEQSALGPLLLSAALESAGLVLDDVTVLDLPPDRQLEAWADGSVDAVVSYGPVAALLEERHATRLFDSRNMPDTIFDVLAVRSDRLDHPALRPTIAAHFRALDHLLRNREDALYRISHRQRVTVEDVARTLGGVTLPDLQRNLGYLDQDGRVTAAARDLSALMAARGLLPAPDTLERLVDAGHLPGPG